MNAVRTATVRPMSTAGTAGARVRLIGLLRLLLVSEAVLTLGLAVFLSLVAVGLREALAGDAGRAAEETVRFAAAAAFLFAVFATIAARGARRRRGWSWTLTAILQLILAIGTGVAVMTATWHPVYLIGFGLAAAVMLVLSSAGVRGALGQT